VLWFDSQALKAAANTGRRQNYKYAGYIPPAGSVPQSPDHPGGRVLYGKVELDVRKSDQKQFD